MSNLMSGTEALAALGIGHKKGPMVDMLKEFGLLPFHQQRQGRGWTAFYRPEDVQAAVDREQKRIKNRVDSSFFGKPMGMREIADTINRIEKKIDLLAEEISLQTKRIELLRANSGQ